MKTVTRKLLATFVLALIATVVQGQSPRGAGGAAKPVRSSESLATLALPDTTIESAALDPNNPGICRVTAVTTHPPAGDKVKIWSVYPHLIGTAVSLERVEEDSP